MQPPLVLRFCGLDLFGLRQRRKQRLRFGNLRHLGRRRETFERGREGGVGFDEATGRLKQPSEGKRRQKSGTERALPFRDGDRNAESFLSRSGIGGIALEQDFAAQSMEERERATKFDCIREPEGFVDASQRRFRTQGFRLKLREQSRVESQIDPNPLLDESR